MNVRILFNRQSLIALLLAPFLCLSMESFEFHQPPLFKAAAYQLTPQFFKFISAGFWPATVDLLWMQTLQRVGDANYDSSTLEESLGFYRLVTSLDPNFYEIYDQAAVVFGFYYEAPDAAIEVIDRGVQVYEQGTYPQAFWTHPYSLFLNRAYINAFLKNNWKDAKRDYLRAAAMPHSPPYLQSMKLWLAEEGSEGKLAVRVLKVLLANEKDPVIKARYQEKLKKYE